MKSNYLVAQYQSDIVFAVISNIENNADLISKVCLAVQEEFCYNEGSTKLVPNTFKDSGFFTTLDIVGVCDDGEEEIREIELKLTAIY